MHRALTGMLQINRLDPLWHGHIRSKRVRFAASATRLRRDTGTLKSARIWPNPIKVITTSLSEIPAQHLVLVTRRTPVEHAGSKPLRMQAERQLHREHSAIHPALVSLADCIPVRQIDREDENAPSGTVCLSEQSNSSMVPKDAVGIRGGGPLSRRFSQDSQPQAVKIVSSASCRAVNSAPRACLSPNRAFSCSTSRCRRSTRLYARRRQLDLAGNQ